MRKIISGAFLIVVAMIFLCSSALALDATDVIGVWYFNEIEQGDFIMNPAALGMSMAITLNEDGTVKISADGEDDEEEVWVIEGDALVIGEGESSLELVLIDGSLVADMGEEGKMTFGRELAVEVTHADFPVVAANDIAEFDGEWTGSLAEMFGLKIPMGSELLGMDLSLSIQNGEITLRDTSVEGDPTEVVIQGVLEDGTLVTAYSMYFDPVATVINLREDGSLSFDIEGEAILYFVKAE